MVLLHHDLLIDVISFSFLDLKYMPLFQWATVADQVKLLLSFQYDNITLFMSFQTWLKHI